MISDQTVRHVSSLNIWSSVLFVLLQSSSDIHQALMSHYLHRSGRLGILNELLFRHSLCGLIEGELLLLCGCSFIVLRGPGDLVITAAGELSLSLLLDARLAPKMLLAPEGGFALKVGEIKLEILHLHFQRVNPLFECTNLSVFLNFCCNLMFRCLRNIHSLLY